MQLLMSMLYISCTVVGVNSGKRFRGVMNVMNIDISEYCTSSYYYYYYYAAFNTPYVCHKMTNRRRIGECHLHRVTNI